MRKFNNGKAFHGSQELTSGKLTGSTDTDYFYLFCPKCGDTQVLQILDYGVISEGPVEYAPEARRKARKDFILAFELYCSSCKLHDYVKISNIGWQGGKLKNRLAQR